MWILLTVGTQPHDGHRGNLTLLFNFSHPWCGRNVQWRALFTFIADTFASKVAAIQDQYADACVGNVTGSNAVNVFLGIGVAWSVAAIHWKIKGEVFRVDPGSLAFSVTLFTIFAFLSMGVLMLRRRSWIGSELGGPLIPKLLTSLIFFGLWFLYILLSSLVAYNHIQGFWWTAGWYSDWSICDHTLVNTLHQHK